MSTSENTDCLMATEPTTTTDCRTPITTEPTDQMKAEPVERVECECEPTPKQQRLSSEEDAAGSSEGGEESEPADAAKDEPELPEVNFNLVSQS